jgi:signal transduction histidine kinase/HAMP domain-containing protein/putative methionine-R-sulfoxide reductase with GAF domain
MARRRRLFWKYVVFFTLLVTVALLASGLIEIYFSYQESKVVLGALQREKAQAAAVRIEGFITEIERQMGWVTQPRAVAAAPLEQRRFDFYRLQRQVPPITEISYIDPTGREQVRVSRLAMDVFGSNLDLSADPRFTEARARRLYRGPVYFRKESEPYMAIAIAEGGQGGGVTAAEVNLKFIWDVVSQIKVGKAGQAFVVDGQGALIAHPDISLVLQKTDLGRLAHVKAALTPSPAPGDAADTATVARNLKDQRVLTAHVTIPSLRWTVFVELPLEEAFAPLEASVRRTVLLELIGIALSVIVSLILARTMVKPIRALQAGAARFGEGNLTDRIAVHTGDELEGLAEQFNSMAGKLHESYAGLERKVEERTHELSEALEQQTATAEVLRVISSSPTDLQPVMDAVVESAARLCGAQNAQIFQIEGTTMRLVARHGPVTSSLEAGETRPLTRGSVSGRVALERRTLRIDDLRVNLQAEYPDIAAAIQRQGIAATVGVPLLREGVAIGAITAFRTEARPFTDQQVALLETFADQAVIAIENVRLFQELQVRNRALTESLEQQTATAEILRVISSSPTDLQPVLEAVAANAARVCEASDAVVLRVDGDALKVVANYGAIPAMAAAQPIGPDWVAGRSVVERRPVHVADLAAELGEYPRSRAMQERTGHRTIVAMPMLREGVPIGVIVIRRMEVRPFSDKQVALLETFADQAVIAIENVRLFQELQARTHDLSQSLEETGALSEVIRAVSSSLDLREVLDAVARRAVTLAGADGCGIFEYSPDRGRFDAVVSQGISRRFLDTIPVAMNQGTLGRATQSGEPVQVADVQAVPDYPFRDRLVAEGLRAVLTVPMMGGDVARGMVLFRRTPGEFGERVVTLMRTLADQSKVAIANAHLFREIEEKGRLLEVANQHKSEFLANMSHELRTPLNAIIGFSEVLLQRMFGELNPKQDEYLQDVLSSGRHLLSLINDILDLSKVEAGRMELELERFDLPQALQDTLVLVRERAVRHGIDLHLDADARLGILVADERKIKQVMLNLLSNAVKFTPEGGRVEVRAVPTDGAVEISVADTGIGIAPENQELIFEEFRQVGGDYAHKREGTGLGLTLARKLVELHGGRLWVKSQIGQGSTFTFSVPERPWPAS